MSGVHSEAIRPMLLSSGLSDLPLVPKNHRKMMPLDLVQVWTRAGSLIEAT
jgi:hypothetical protein